MGVLSVIYGSNERGNPSGGMRVLTQRTALQGATLGLILGFQ